MTFEIEAAIHSPDDDAAFEALAEVEAALHRHIANAMDIGLISQGSAFSFKLNKSSLGDCSLARQDAAQD